MNKTNKLLLTAAIAIGFTQVWAGVILSESFEYGNSTIDIRDLSNYTANSGVLRYVHDVNLTHPTLLGETGGSFSEQWDDANPGNRTAVKTVSSFSYGNVSQGESIWYSMLIQWNEADVATVVFSNSTSNVGTSGTPPPTALGHTGHFVSAIGAHIDASGNISVAFWTDDDNDNSFQALDTGMNATLGSTHLLVLRATKGAGASPSDSSVDFWLDPTFSDLSTGTPDYQSGTISKWGRDDQSFNGLYLNSGTRNYIDEIRVGESLEDLNLIPEPGTLVLVGIALGCLMIFRRRT